MGDETWWIVQSVVLCVLSTFFIAFFVAAIWVVRARDNAAFAAAVAALTAPATATIAAGRNAPVQPANAAAGGGGGTVRLVSVSPAPQRDGTIVAPPTPSAAAAPAPAPIPAATDAPAPAPASGGSGGADAVLVGKTGTFSFGGGSRNGKLAAPPPQRAAGLVVVSPKGASPPAPPTPSPVVISAAASAAARANAKARARAWTFLDDCRWGGLAAAITILPVGIDVEGGLDIVSRPLNWTFSVLSTAVLWWLAARWAVANTRLIFRQMNKPFPRPAELCLYSLPVIFVGIGYPAVMYYTIADADKMSRLGFVIFRVLQAFTASSMTILLLWIYFRLRAEFTRFMIQIAAGSGSSGGVPGSGVFDSSYLTASLRRLFIPTVILAIFLTGLSVNWAVQAADVITNHELYDGVQPSATDFATGPVIATWIYWIFLSLIAWYGSPFTLFASGSSPPQQSAPGAHRQTSVPSNLKPNPSLVRSPVVVAVAAAPVALSPTVKSTPVDASPLQPPASASATGLAVASGGGIVIDVSPPNSGSAASN